MKEPTLIDFLIRRRLVGPLALTGIVCFLTTSLFLHQYLESLESSDVLQRSSDWRLGDHNRLGNLMYQPTTASTDKKEKEVLNLIKLEYEEEYPPENMARVKSFVRSLRRSFGNYQTQPGVPYDVFNCPATPPPGYPMEWDVMEVLGHWNAANTTDPPQRIHQGLCVFDYEADLDKALSYQKAEVPFLLHNTPDLLRTAERWSRDPTYLSRQLAHTLQKVEHSHNNHFMYWKMPNNYNNRRRRNNNKIPPGWTPPMDETRLTYDEWLQKARTVTSNDPDQERWYFRVNAAPGRANNSFLYDELPMFRATPSKPTIFMVQPEEQRGINCRFGMKGVIAGEFTVTFWSFV